MKQEKALGPWVAQLRKTIYKGIGKHSSSKSPAMNFDRSAVSLRPYIEIFSLIMLTKLTVGRTLTFLYINLCKTCDLWGGAIFGPRGMI